MHVNVCVHVCVCVYVSAYVWVYVHVCMRVKKRGRAREWESLCVRERACACVQVRAYIHAQIVTKGEKKEGREGGRERTCEQAKEREGEK